MSSDPHAPPAVDVDVLVVGAGISGVGLACRLTMHCPDLAYAVLEARDSLGGTWDLFRYPGVRSDSDMYTLGFPFRPWTGPGPIASGEQILDYLRETAAEHHVTERIHLGQRVTRLEWSSSEALWRVHARQADGTERVHRARFVHLATGYYAYDSGHVVDFPGQADFAGPVVHPQHWPPGLAVRDRRFVVVGSGATAVTLVPSLVERGARHVTMLQRSPTYVAALPTVDAVSGAVRAALPAAAAHRVLRARNVAVAEVGYRLMRRYPAGARRVLARRLRERLPAGFPVHVHFAPAYDPWDQRLCLVPDGDLLDALGSGRAEVVTATLQRFVPEGVRLADGRVLEADVVVTATGLRLQVAGGAEVVVDGERVDLPSRHVYKGAMLSGVPNLALSLGYPNASWTLRSDLTARWVCGLLRHLDRRSLSVAVPRWDGSVASDEPIIALGSGYVRRGAHLLPRQGSRRPWRVGTSYVQDLLATRLGRVEDGVLELR